MLFVNALLNGRSAMLQGMQYIFHTKMPVPDVLFDVD